MSRFPEVLSSDDRAMKRLNELFDVQWDRVDDRQEINFKLAQCELRVWSEVFPDIYAQVFFLRAVRYLRNKYHINHRN